MNNPSEAIRLQKWIAQAGIASRRKAEEIIQAGRVCINGVVITELGAKANPNTDKVTVDGKPAELNRQEKIYVMLHKPEGVVTTVTDLFGRTTVIDILPADMTTRLYPVGRLDYDTSGLIFLTNDGDWTQKVTHPKYEVKKTYVAVVKGIPSEQLLKKFRDGLKIDNKKTAPCQAVIDEKKKQVNATTLRITIHEGRNRQVRKMCDAIGHPVIKLKRVAVGDVKLGDLKKGEWRYLTAQEVKKCLTF